MLGGLVLCGAPGLPLDLCWWRPRRQGRQCLIHSMKVPISLARCKGGNQSCGRLEVTLDRCLHHVTKVPLPYPFFALLRSCFILRQLTSPKRCAFSCLRQKERTREGCPFFSCGSGILWKRSPSSTLYSRVFLIAFCFVVACKCYPWGRARTPGLALCRTGCPPSSVKLGCEAFENTSQGDSSRTQNRGRWLMYSELHSWETITVD